MPKASKSKIPKSFLGRASKLLAAGATVLSREVGSAVAAKLNERPEFAKIQTRIKQAQDLVNALSSLKGAAMKAGQLISLEMSDLLPKEVVEVLRKLHDSATFMDFSEVEKILVRELGEKAYARIEDLSQTPIAAASIGQVHRGKIDGKDVAIKVQYPGVADTIDSDLAMLQKILKAFLIVKKKSISFDRIFAELAEGLKLEVDYKKEAASLLTYRKAFANLPQYIIPEVLTHYSTSRVLTLSYEEGERMNTWLRKHVSKEERLELADLVLSLLFEEIFAIGVVQTDPNYGNFLVRAHDRGVSLVLLDFGAVRTYDVEFRRKVRELLKASMDRNHEKALQLGIEFGLLDDREPQNVKDHYLHLMDLIVQMFRSENQPFSFSNEGYLKDIRDVSLGFADVVHYTSPASHMIFLNRKLGGMFHLLKDAGASLDVARFWERLLRLDLDN